MGTMWWWTVHRCRIVIILYEEFICIYFSGVVCRIISRTETDIISTVLFNLFFSLAPSAIFFKENCLLAPMVAVVYSLRCIKWLLLFFFVQRLLFAVWWLALRIHWPVNISIYIQKIFFVFTNSFVRRNESNGIESIRMNRLWSRILT